MNQQDGVSVTPQVADSVAMPSQAGGGEDVVRLSGSTFDGSVLADGAGGALARVIDADTGALEPTSRLEAVLDAYQDAYGKAMIAQMDLDALKRQTQASLETSDEWLEAYARLDAAQLVVRSIEAGLSEALAGRPLGTNVKIDTGRVVVTAPKARSTNKLAHPVAWYQTIEARGELVAALGYKLASEQRMLLEPSAQLDANKLHTLARELAQAALEWLEPHASLQDTNPPVKVTVRAPKGV